MKLNRKVSTMIDMSVDACSGSMDERSRINLLCAALAVSSEGTRHHTEAMDLIKAVCPNSYRLIKGAEPES